MSWRAAGLAWTSSCRCVIRTVGTKLSNFSGKAVFALLFFLRNYRAASVNRSPRLLDNMYIDTVGHRIKAQNGMDRPIDAGDVNVVKPPLGLVANS
jgi:hypothetical protein